MDQRLFKKRQRSLSFRSELPWDQPATATPSRTPLQQLVESSYGRPDLAQLKEAVMAGGNVVSTVRLPSYEEIPILSLFIDTEQLEAVVTCLQSPLGINFNATGPSEATPLHFTAEVYPCRGKAFNQLVMRAVVKRLLENNPGDSCDWFHVPAETVDLFSLMAENQLLSTLWPEIQDLPVLSPQYTTGLMALRTSRWEWDWNALPREAQERFLVTPKCVEHYSDRITGKLWQLVECHPINLPAVRVCVARRANVLFQPGDPSMWAILLHCCRCRPLEVVQALLETPLPIDFTMGARERHQLVSHQGTTTSPQGTHAVPQRERRSVRWFRPCRGYTPLHVLAFGKESEEMAALLHLVLDRLEAHPEDTVDWGLRDSNGEEPIAVAAYWGSLSTWVRIVYHERPVAYYVQHTKRISLRRTVKRLDWNQMAPEDQDRFELVGGLRDFCLGERIPPKPVTQWK